MHPYKPENHFKRQQKKYVPKNENPYTVKSKLERQTQLPSKNCVLVKQLKFVDFEEKSCKEKQHPINLILYCFNPENFLVVSFKRRDESDSLGHQNFIENTLKNGIILENEKFKFIGHSNSQLKSGTCFMYKDNTDDIFGILCCIQEQFTDKAIRAKRKGLLFTTATCVVDMPFDMSQLDDIKRDNFNFTDGCGFISPQFARKISEKLCLPFDPSVFQIRYQGTKGVVIQNPSMEKLSIQFRGSMQKFTVNHRILNNKLCIVQHSRPTNCGYLNLQLILLLSTLGISEEIFIQKCTSYLDSIQNITSNAYFAWKWLLMKRNSKLAQDIEKSVLNSTAVHLPIDELAKIQQAEKATLQKSKFSTFFETLPTKDRLRIPVIQSRTVFGVCDISEKLRYGECFFQPTICGSPTILQGCRVVVSRNPCYHPGDVRLLKVVDVPECRHLRDCIVFPVKGKRPHADEMSGGDLDGDEFFVCWDPELIPKEIEEPASYQKPAKQEATRQPNNLNLEEIRYFASQNANVIGDIDSTFLKFAAAKGIRCKQCQELGEMFSMAIDFAPTNHARLKTLQQAANALSPDKPKFWQILLAKINQLYDDCSSKETASHPSTQPSFIKSFLEDTEIRWLLGEKAYNKLHAKFTNRHHVPDTIVASNIMPCSFQCTKLDCAGNHPSVSDSINIMRQLASTARSHLDNMLISCKLAMEDQYRPKKILEEEIVALKSSRDAVCRSKADLENSLVAIENKLQSLSQEIKITEEQIGNIQKDIETHKSIKVKLETFWNNLFGNKTSKLQQKEMLQALEEKLQERKNHEKRLREEQTQEFKFKANVLEKHRHMDKILEVTLQVLQEKEYQDATFDLKEFIQARQQYEEQWKIEQQFESNIEMYIDRLKNHSGDRRSFLAKIQQPFFRELQQLNPEPEQRPLPIYARKNEIIEMVHKNAAVVIGAETGSGKTTQIVQYLADSGLERIVCTQPRRLAAREMCNRVQQQYGKDLVSYIVGGMSLQEHQEKRKTHQQPVITFVTTGVLVAQSKADPYFNKYSVVIVDEAHERSLEIDLLLGLLKRAMQKRPDLKVVITSASINTGKFRTYFHCPFMEIPGKIHPVAVHYRPLNLEEECTIAAAELAFKIHHTKKPDGHILIFLPGKSCINKTCEWLNQKLNDQFHPEKRKKMEEELDVQISEMLYLVVPLHSALSVEEQKIAVEPSNKRKIIVSTNVAETSITIKDVAYVIDSGFFKEKSHAAGFGSFLVQRISQASAKQRMGRAGRTCPGECYRLYSEEEHNSMIDYHPPQILRVPFAGTLLMLKNQQLENLEFMDPVPKEEVAHAKRLLTRLKALDEAGNLTSIGKQMCAIPAEPCVAKMILEGHRLGCLTDVLTIAAMLSIHDTVFIHTNSEELSDEKKARFIHESGDHLTLLNVYNAWIKEYPKQKKWCRNNFINFQKMNEAHLLRKKLESCLPSIGIQNQYHPSSHDAICEAICRGFWTNACCPNDQSNTSAGFTLVETNIMALLHPSSALNWSANLIEGTWVICHEHVKTNLATTYLKTVTRIRPEWLPEPPTRPSIFKVTINVGPLVKQALFAGKPPLIQKMQQETETMIAIAKGHYQLFMWSLNKSHIIQARNRVLKLQQEISNTPKEKDLTIETQHMIRSVRVKVQSALQITSVILHQNQSTRIKIYGLSGQSDHEKLKLECQKRGANFYRTNYGYHVADFPSQDKADKAIFDLDGSAFIRSGITIVESNPHALCIGTIQPTRDYSYKLFVPKHLQDQEAYDKICQQLRIQIPHLHITTQTKKCTLIIFRTPNPVSLPNLLGCRIIPDTGITALIPRKLMLCPEFERELQNIPVHKVLKGSEFYRILIDCSDSERANIITRLKLLLKVKKIKLDPTVDMKEYNTLWKTWNAMKGVFVQLMPREQVVAIAGLADAKKICEKQVLRDINNLVEKYRTLEIPLPLDFAPELQKDPEVSHIPILWKSNKIILKGDDMQYENYILNKIWDFKKAEPNCFKCCRCQASTYVFHLSICGHPYCKQCLRRQFAEASQDGTYLVRCKLCNNGLTMEDLKNLQPWDGDAFLACAVQSRVSL